MSKNETAIAAAQAKIEHGLTGEFLRSALESRIPKLWGLNGRALVFRDLDARERHEDRAAIFASASRIGFVPAGAKISVDLTQPIDLLAIAQELGTMIADRIAVREAATRSCNVLRFALEPGARPPTRGSEGSSGYDLYAPKALYIAPGAIIVVHSGVMLELPAGFEGQVRGRSSMSKRGLWVATGTIDSDYRGVIGATITNVAQTAQKIEEGDRIAQVVIQRVEHPTWVRVDSKELTQTERGGRGFGSTGR